MDPDNCQDLTQTVLKVCPSQSRATVLTTVTKGGLHKDLNSRTQHPEHRDDNRRRSSAGSAGYPGIPRYAASLKTKTKAELRIHFILEGIRIQPT